MLSKELQDALNEQLNWELYYSYVYLSMSAYFESKDMKGFAHWMRIQVQEELLHVTKLYDYVSERDGRVLLQAVDGPALEWDSPLDAFENALAHEQGVTERINNLASLALEQKDHACMSFLRWFVDEQVEEEASARTIIQKLKLIGNEGSGLFLVDTELAQRVFTPPADSAGQ